MIHERTYLTTATEIRKLLEIERRHNRLDHLYWFVEVKLPGSRTRSPAAPLTPQTKPLYEQMAALRVEGWTQDLAVRSQIADVTGSIWKATRDNTGGKTNGRTVNQLHTTKPSAHPGHSVWF